LALAKKYLNSNQESIWQYVFPSHSLLPDEQDCIIRRFQIIKIGLQKAVKTAVQKVVFPKKVSCHNFRYCFAPHLLRAGYYTQHLRFWAGFRTTLELLGHKDLKTSMKYTLIPKRGTKSVRSLFDEVKKLLYPLG